MKRILSQNKLLPKSNILCFSLKKLNKTYNGPLMTVRRSSDDATIDIGFYNNYLDKKKLKDFMGSSNGYVVNWYSQDMYNSVQSIATQSILASQPQIAENGNIFDSVLFDGVDDFMTIDRTSKLNITANDSIALYCDSKYYEGDNGYVFSSNETSIYYMQYSIYRGFDVDISKMSIRFDWTEGNSGRFWTKEGVINGVFQKFFGTYDGGFTVKSGLDNYKDEIYDGGLVQTQAVTPDLVVGARHNTGNTYSVHIKVNIKDLLVFNKAIERNDISGLFSV